MSKFTETVSDLCYDIIINPLHDLKYNIKWLLPRLKLFAEKTVCYPENYKSMSSWQKELINRVTQLELIVTYNYDEHNFPEFKRYLTTKELEEYRKNMDENQIKYIAFGKCMKNFNKWFNTNINDLWY